MDAGEQKALLRKDESVSQLTIESLKDILNEAAGEDDVQLGDESLDTPFLDLGFDSLAMLETVSLIKRKFGVGIADDEVANLETPRDLLTKVNAELKAA